MPPNMKRLTAAFPQILFYRFAVEQCAQKTKHDKNSERSRNENKRF